MIGRRKLLGLSGAILAGGSLGLLTGCNRRDAGTSGEPVRFASPTPVWWNAVPLIAQRHELYASQGVNIEAFDVPTGVKAKEAIVQRNADMGVAATNAFTVTTPEHLGELRVLASLMQSDATVSIVSRRPLDNLEGMTIGVVPNSIGHFYLIAYLQQQNKLDLYTQEPRRIRIVDLTPPTILTGFSRGDVDAISMWEPFASQAIELERQRVPNVEPAVIRVPSLYTQHIFAVASRDIVERRREDVDAVLAALRASCEYIEGNRPAVGAELEQFFDFPQGFLTGNNVWDQVQFRYSTDRAMMEAALRRDFELAQLVGPSIAQAGSEQNLFQVLGELA